MDCEIVTSLNFDEFCVLFKTFQFFVISLAHHASLKLKVGTFTKDLTLGKKIIPTLIYNKNLKLGISKLTQKTLNQLYKEKQLHPKRTFLII